MDDLKRAFDALKDKLPIYNELFQYYDGDQPLKYSTQKLKEIFQTIDARFNQNWCAVVVNAVLERLHVQGWDAEDETINDALDAYFDKESVFLEIIAAHEAAAVCGEGFVIVWPDEENEPQTYANDPRLVHAFYQADNPREMEFAAKWWVGTGNLRYMTLYYPDRLEYYVSDCEEDKVSTVEAMVPAEPPQAPNPYGRIPVFHLQRNRRSGDGELANVIQPQDAINKLFADMMVAAEFGAFRQRYIISMADEANLKNAPNEIWQLSAGDGLGQATSVGQFEATDLDNYLQAIDKLANVVAVITRTPKHYFLEATGANISGEALIAMEAPLNKKTDTDPRVFGVTWKEVGAFVASLLGYTIDASELTVVWEPGDTTQPFTEAQTRKTSVDADIPLVTQLKREGWTQAELDELEKDEKAAKSKQTSVATALLAQARAEQQQQNPQDAQPVNNLPGAIGA